MFGAFLFGLFALSLACFGQVSTSTSESRQSQSSTPQALTSPKQRESE
jgi:amino acid transporter